MARFASEKNAFGTCDRCDFRYPLRSLRKERKNRSQHNLRVCPECYDTDHPQSKLGDQAKQDNEGLRDPRIDLSQLQSRYADAIQYEFTDNITGWSATNSSVAHDLTNGYMTHTWTSATDPQVHTTAASFSASSYEIIRMRIMITDWSALRSTADWTGGLYWGRSTDSGFPVTVASRLVSIPEPSLQMGDPWLDLAWDMNGVTDWDGTVTGLRFDLFGGSSSTGTIDIDWIRIDKKVT